MFFYLSGQITHIEPNLAVVDCGGVGYAVHTTAHTLAALKVGTSAKLFTHTHVREDAFEIYGFASQTELDVFKLLISVNGVGMRSALAVLSTHTTDELVRSIIAEDDVILRATPGIGQKTASRIILELKDKLSRDLSEADEADLATSTDSPHLSQAKRNSITEALSVLGYTPAEAAAALRNLPQDVVITADVSDIIKMVLAR